MGNQHTSSQFNDNQWKLISSPYNSTLLYESLQNPNFHIEKHRILHQNKQDYHQDQQLCLFRLKHPKIVSSVYYEEKECFQSQFCVYNYEAAVYIQKIPIRLSDLKDIAFPYVLYLYNQVLQGYDELSKYVGCFTVESDYIGINQNGVCKIWAGPKWSQITVKLRTVSEQDMVKSIFESIEEYVDKSSMPPQNPSIRNFVYRKSDRINFQIAIDEIIQYIHLTNNGLLPVKLINIDEHSSQINTKLNTQPNTQINTQLNTQLNSQQNTQLNTRLNTQFNTQRICIYDQRPSINQISMTSSDHPPLNHQYSDHFYTNNALSPRFTMKTVQGQYHNKVLQNKPKSQFYYQNNYVTVNRLPQYVGQNRSKQSIYYNQNQIVSKKPEISRFQGENANIPQIIFYKQRSLAYNQANVPLLANSSSKQLATNTSHHLFHQNQNAPLPSPRLQPIINHLYQPLPQTNTLSYNNSRAIISHRSSHDSNLIPINQISTNQQETYNRRPIKSLYTNINGTGPPKLEDRQQRPRFMSRKADSIDISQPGHSIIMKLYNEDGSKPTPQTSFNRDSQILNQGDFRLLKNSQSVKILEEQSKPIETITLINQHIFNQIKGIPQKTFDFNDTSKGRYQNYSYIRYPYAQSKVQNVSVQHKTQQPQTLNYAANFTKLKAVQIKQDDGKTPPGFFNQFKSFDTFNLDNSQKSKGYKKVGFELAKDQMNGLNNKNNLKIMGRSAQSNKNEKQLMLTKQFSWIDNLK